MDTIDTYIQALLNGTIRVEEHGALKRWINRSAENKRYFQESVAIWKATAILSNEEHFNVDKAVARFKAENKRCYTLDTYKWALRASSVAIILLLGGITSLLFLWRSGKAKDVVAREYKEYVVEVPVGGAKSKLTLSDGSIVWLNAGSKITYDSDFARASRRVSLAGEGYFEVAKNKDLPFVIQTEKIEVQVLGTKFNLKSYAEDEAVKVVLKEGAVQIADLCDAVAPVLLEPNQRFTYQKSDHSVKIDSVDATHIEDWRDGRMVFDKVSLEEIVKELRRQYDLPIRIENKKLGEIVYYSDFKGNESVGDVLEILSSGHKFNYEIQPDFIRIYN